MLSKLFLLLLVVIIFKGTDPDYVKEYHQISTRQMESSFIKKYSNRTNPNIKGYVLSIKMKQSQYSFLPWIKFKKFKTEKENL